MIGSCFVRGTKVAMADGSERNIEDIRIGDRVRGQNGATNAVTGIERPWLAGRLLYAINGGRAFVTAEHPFWTADGWKAIDPEATVAENPHLRVAALVVGDRVAATAMAASGAVTGPTALSVAFAPEELREVAIRSILGVTASPDTVVYNLLLDGNHTYFANGYLVHNKEGQGP